MWRLLLLATVRAELHLRSWQVAIDGDTRGGLVAEQWGSNRVDFMSVYDANGVVEGVSMRGNNRLFAVVDYVWSHKWRALLRALARTR
jgi:hypothetical protein